MLKLLIILLVFILISSLNFLNAISRFSSFLFKIEKLLPTLRLCIFFKMNNLSSFNEKLKILLEKNWTGWMFRTDVLTLLSHLEFLRVFFSVSLPCSLKSQLGEREREGRMLNCQNNCPKFGSLLGKLKKKFLLLD